jgi:heat shock protein HslJ
MRLLTAYFIPAALALTLGTACEGPKNTTDGNTTVAAEHTALTGKNWKLEQLMGAPVVGRNAAGAPYIHFAADTNRVTGSTGCNNFFGTYKLTAPGKITFGTIGSTKRACPNMDVEANYLKALNSATSYKLDGQMLTLGDDKTAELAKFRMSTAR